MAAIFLLSAQPDLSTGLGLIDLVARKVAHAAIYAALCVAWWRVLELRLPLPRAVALAATFTVAYALSDEWHQTFVPGRSGSGLDVAIDALGAGGAAGARLWVTGRRQAGLGARRRPAAR